MTSPVRYTIRCDNCDRACSGRKEENLIAHASVVHHGYTVDAANREVPKQVVEAMERAKQQFEDAGS